MEAIQNEDIISLDIKFFKELFIFIEEILNWEFPVHIKEEALRLFPIFEKKDEKIKEEIIYFFAKALGECIYKQSSLLLRYILTTIFKIDFYNNICDNDIESDEICKDKDESKEVFDSKILKAENFDDIFKSEKRELKDLGKFFTSYKSPYDIDIEKKLTEEAKKVFMSYIQNNNKFTKLDRLLLKFPNYFTLFHKTIDCIFSGHPFQYVQLIDIYYIAILGAASIECDFLVKDLIAQFLIYGGDDKWIIRGIRSSPQYIQNWGNIANYLANQPWKIPTDLLKSLNFEIEKWIYYTMSLILTTFQRYASIIKSFGISIVSPENNNKEKNQSVEKTKPKEDYQKVLKEIKKNYNSKETMLVEEIEYLLQREKEILTEIPRTQSVYRKFVFSHCQKYDNYYPSMKKYIFYLEYVVDFPRQYQLSDCWEEVTKCIFSEFKLLETMTSYCLGNHEKIESTEIFRKAIIAYVEKLYGLADRGFNYEKTNKLIPKIIKSNIKRIVCFPHTVNFNEVSRNDFNEEDIIHIIFLSLITKHRVQLTYTTYLAPNEE